MGTTRGKASFEAFTHRKTVAIQAPNFDPLAKYPPYDVSLKKYSARCGFDARGHRARAKIRPRSTTRTKSPRFLFWGSQIGPEEGGALRVEGIHVLEQGGSDRYNCRGVSGVLLVKGGIVRGKLRVIEWSMLAARVGNVVVCLECFLRSSRSARLWLVLSVRPSACFVDNTLSFSHVCQRATFGFNGAVVPACTRRSLGSSRCWFPSSSPGG